MNHQKNTIRKYLLVFISILILSCNTDTIEEHPDRVAVVNGEYDLGWLINHYMIYPKSERNVNRAGIVELSWIVTKEGVVKDVTAFVITDDQHAASAIARKRIQEKEVLKLNQPILENLMYSVELLKFIPALKDGILAAAISIVAPVCGLRPVRAARSRTEKVPKPTRATCSPLFNSSVTASIKESNARPAAALEISALAAIVSTS